MQLKVFVILITLVILGWVIDLIRREKMTFKYSVVWFGGCLLALIFVINQNLLVSVSRFAGFALPSNFIFFLLLVFVMFLSLMLTLYINEQNSRAESLAQAIASLQQQIKVLKQEKKEP
ncbi:MAG TPA: DUF2304 domain-containing protein [Candidatus Omnitrophota bacterium]|nr:DUF2304 domain-containing protein [Candidatus Omnitrophota bacterium]